MTVAEAEETKIKAGREHNVEHPLPEAAMT